MLIADAWSGDSELIQALKPTRPDRALVDVAQGLLRSCIHSAVCSLSHWLQQRLDGTAADKRPRSAVYPLCLQHKDLVDCFADLKTQQQLTNAMLDDLRRKCKCRCASKDFVEVQG
ncbi:hypothetical protein PsorP6_010614 [Peronosclerospora sorghi]|uniref:Uncharacterized protein n=1 Tax=Peronosclerospora sorghi TaxID=230839 RepID=A0ACC0VWQ8_9STRA|nr:hypothetical protein PsorP6_010614 [Peronosclerospora sorghi]